MILPGSFGLVASEKPALFEPFTLTRAHLNDPGDRPPPPSFYGYARTGGYSVSGLIVGPGGSISNEPLVGVVTEAIFAAEGALGLDGQLKVIGDHTNSYPPFYLHNLDSNDKWQMVLDGYDAGSNFTTWIVTSYMYLSYTGDVNLVFVEGEL